MEQIARSPKTLGHVIKRQRKLKNLTQSEVGNTFNIMQYTLSNVEQGAPKTRIDTIFKLLAALDLEMVIRPKSKTTLTDEDW